MFASFRRFQKWIWIFAIIVIIPSFVIFFSDTSFRRGRGPNVDVGSINGRPITREEFIAARQEARLQYFFNTGTLPDTDERASTGLNRDAYVRVLLVEKQKELGVKPSKDAVGKYGAELLRRLGNPPWETFVKEFLQPKAGMTVSDFERYVLHDVGIEELFQVAGVSGKLITQREAEAMYGREKQELAVDLVPFKSSNYLASVSVDEAKVGEFFTNRMALYRVPERVRLNYVEFGASNYFGEADKQIEKITNYNTLVEQFYLKQGTNFFKDTNGVVLSEATAKQKIKDDERRRLALIEARKKANEFVSQLLAQPHGLASFERLAAAVGYPVNITEPFDRDGVPKEFKLPPKASPIASGLSTNEPILISPIIGENAVYVVALKEGIPSQMPLFDAVREKVAEDYRQQQALEAVQKAGNDFYGKLSNGLALGQSFAAICLEANVNPISLPPFSIATNSIAGLDETINVNLVKNIALSLKPGSAAPFLQMPDGGFVLFLRAKLPVDENRMRAEMPQFVAALRHYQQNEAFSRWLQQQQTDARMTMPLLQTQSKPGAPPVDAQ